MITFQEHVAEAANAGYAAYNLCGSYERAIQEYLVDAGIPKGPERERIRDAAMKKCYFELIASARDF